MKIFAKMLEHFKAKEQRITFLQEKLRECMWAYFMRGFLQELLVSWALGRVLCRVYGLIPLTFSITPFRFFANVLHVWQRGSFHQKYLKCQLSISKTVSNDSCDFHTLLTWNEPEMLGRKELTLFHSTTDKGSKWGGINKSHHDILGCANLPLMIHAYLNDAGLASLMLKYNKRNS